MVCTNRLSTPVRTALVLLGTIFICAPPAAAADDAIAVSFAPQSVEISPGGSRTVVLTIANPTAFMMAHPQVDLHTDAGVTATRTGEEIRDLASGQTAAVEILVSRSATAPKEASVEAVVTWSRDAGSTGRVQGRAGVASLTVTSPPDDTGAVTVTATAGSATLLEYQATDVFFVVQNGRSTSQLIESATLDYPSFLDVSYVAPGSRPDSETWTHEDGTGTMTLTPPEDESELGPGAAAVLHLRIQANALQPGPSVLMLTVQVEDTATHQEAVLLGSQSMTFSVLGEEGILKVLAIPNLILLPGLVFVIALWALRRYIVPGAGAEAPELTGDGAAAMWVLALPIALACAWLYPVVTSWFGQRRDYRSVYGLVDVLYLWMLAAALAGLLWVGYVVLRWKYLPLPGQDARQILHRYTWRPVARSLTFSKVDKGTQQLRVLRRHGDQLLVCPPIAGSTARTDGVDPLNAADLLRATKGHDLGFDLDNTEGRDAIKLPTWVAVKDVMLSAEEVRLVSTVEPVPASG